LGEETSDMKIVIGLSTESKRSYAENVKRGKARVSFIRIGGIKTA
jgi:hypothetical protein